MIKRTYYILIILIVIILLYNIVFANTNNLNNITEENTIDSFYNDIIVSLNIDYGRAVTQSNYVTLNLDVSGKDIDLNNLKVQFSLDNKNWIGYNKFTQKWENGFFSEYEPYYSNFYIGSNSGLKTVYAKVINANGNVGLASAKINYSSNIQNPYVINPQSIELNNFNGPLSRAGIKGGSGTLYDPYIISNNNTRLIAKMPNVSEVSYYMDEGKWSPWYKVENKQVNIPIVFNNVEGLKEVRIRIKNKYGIEGDSEIIYYLLDYSKPVINLHTNYHSFIAIDGKLEFDLEIYDNLSNTIDFAIEVYFGESKIIDRGKIKIYDDNKPTTTSVAIDGLPKGQLNIKVTVTDEAGNVSTKQISVNSL